MPRYLTPPSTCRDALPICRDRDHDDARAHTGAAAGRADVERVAARSRGARPREPGQPLARHHARATACDLDRESTRLNYRHLVIWYGVYCLLKDIVSWGRV